jgi:hypothetical protein
MARRLDPGLESRDFDEAVQRLDQMPDSAFSAFGLTQRDVAKLRERFGAWPRDARVAGPEPGKSTDTGHPSKERPGEQLPHAARFWGWASSRRARHEAGQ